MSTAGALGPGQISASGRRDLEADREIRRIVAERDVTSLYQPIVDLRTGELVGCEVLSRGPAGSALESAPALFRAAAGAGLHSELDLICRVLGLSRLRDSGVDPGLVFVNVEPGLGHNLSMTDELRDVLKSVPFQVVVELTERALTRQPAALLHHRDDVHARGNLVAIDDLGADPHSLALVPLLKPDILKLDLAIVQGTSVSAGVTAAAAWEYADRAGAVVVAEGIETEEHRARAIALGATWGQGFLFARPGTIPDLARHRRSRALSLPWAGARREPDHRARPPQSRPVSRLMMLVLSTQLEAAARRLGPHGVLLASIQRAEVLQPRLIERYSRIAERAAFVGLVGVGVDGQPGPNLRGGDVDPDDPLAQQWSVAVVGPHFSGALVGVPDPDDNNWFHAVWSLSPEYAAGVAEDLARRLLPTPVPDAPALVPSAPVSIEELRSALAEIMAWPGVRAEAIGEDGLYVEAPAVLASIFTRGLPGPSALSAVSAESRDAVVTAWARARSRTGGSAGVSVRTVDGVEAWLQLSDHRAEYGVYTAILIPRTPESLQPADANEPTDSLAHARLAPEAGRSGWLRKDEQAHILEVDPEACALLGYPSGVLEGTRTLDLIHPEDRDQALTSWIDMLSSPGLSRRVRLRHRRADGRYLWCEVLNHNALTDPSKGYVLSELTDVDAEVTAQQELAHQQQILRTLAETLTTGVALIDADRQIAYANPQMIAITGPLAGERVTAFLPLLHPLDRHQTRMAFRRVVDTGQTVRIKARMTDQSRHECRLFQLDISPTEDGGAVICAADVTEEVRLHEQLEFQATRDALTGCWNRSALLGMVAEEAEPVLGGDGRRHNDRGETLARPLAVLYVDLDGFKQVNDLLGHAAGDALLIQCSERLRSALRSSDDIGRLGGDEFLLICRDVPHLEAAEQVVHTVRAALAHAQAIDASVGLAWTDVAINADTLVALADDDMYAEKVRRRGLTRVGSALPG